MQKSKSNNIFVTSVLIILLIIVLLLVSKYVFSSNTSLISPASNKINNSIATPLPETPVYNPPKVIKYDSSTDLKKELDSVDPKIQDSDFKDLFDLTDSLKSS